MMSTAYASQLMVKLLGPGFARGGTMSMAFIKPVYAGDRLTVHGVIKDKRRDGSATRVVVEVWVENQHGEKTAVGHATGLAH
jgi:acyl dehydratase